MIHYYSLSLKDSACGRVSEPVTFTCFESTSSDKLSSIKEEGMTKVTWNEILEEKFGGGSTGIEQEVSGACFRLLKKNLVFWNL